MEKIQNGMKMVTKNLLLSIKIIKYFMTTRKIKKSGMKMERENL